MSDGKIIYEVRVDGSNIAGDLAAAAQQVSSGASALVSVGERAAKNLANAMAKAFGNVSSGAGRTLGDLSAKFDAIGIKAADAAGLVSPLTQQLKAVAELDYSRLGSLLDSLKSSGAKTVSTVNAGTSKSLTTNTKNSYRSGNGYLQKDELAFLHKGEAVLTAAENQTLRALGGVEGAAAAAGAEKTAEVVQAAAPVAAAAPAMQEINLTVELDGYKVAKAVTAANSEINRQLNAKLTR